MKLLPPQAQKYLSLPVQAATSAPSLNVLLQAQAEAIISNGEIVTF